MLVFGTRYRLLGLDGRLLGVEVLREARGWERPSDHVPIKATFDM